MAYDHANANGLICLTHRYYDPGTGRFINRDPIGYNGGVNLYELTGGNPVNGIDPSGTVVILQPGTSKAGKAAFEQALHLLLTIPKFREVWNGIDSKQAPIYTVVLSGDINTDEYDPPNKTVTWAPHAAIHAADDAGNLLDRFGNVVTNPQKAASESPTIALAHELTHAYFNYKGWGRTLSLSQGGGPMDNFNEQMVIEQYERPIAEALGQNPRTNHRGEPYWVKGVNDR